MFEGPPQNFGGVSLVERFEETDDLRLIVGQRGLPAHNQWRENRLRLQLVKRISTDNCKFLQLGCRPLRCGKFADYEEVKQRRLGIDSVIPEWAVLS